MSFYEIEFPLAALSSETVEAALLEIGAQSITFVDRGDEPVLEPKPGEIRLWSDTLVRALFDESHDAARSIGQFVDPTGRRDRRRGSHHPGGGSGLGTRMARRLEVHALRAAPVGVPHVGRRAG